MFVSCVRSRGGVPPLHAAVPRGAAPRGAPPSRAPSSRGRGVQRARGAPPTAGYRPAPPIVQDTYGEYVSILKPLSFQSPQKKINYWLVISVVCQTKMWNILPCQFFVCENLLLLFLFFYELDVELKKVNQLVLGFRISLQGIITFWHSEGVFRPKENTIFRAARLHTKSWIKLHFRVSRWEPRAQPGASRLEDLSPAVTLDSASGTLYRWEESSEFSFKLLGLNRRFIFALVY